MRFALALSLLVATVVGGADDASRATSLATLSRHLPRSVTFQPGLQNSLSRWIRGSPVFAASLLANVLLPAPEMPMTRTRCMAGIQFCGGRAPHTPLLQY